MDQNKTDLPQVSENFASLQDATKLRTHVFGTWNFGRELLCYIDCREWPHNTSANITSLLLTIHKHRDNLPDRLYCQFDNTCSQNKNNIMFGFFGYLVEKGIFREAQMGYMMKGHTHSCLDRVFSRVSKQLMLSATKTLDDLKEKIKTSYRSRTMVGMESTVEPTITEFELVYDFKEWLKEKVIVDKMSEMGNFHQFKFCLDQETNKCVMYYAQWANDDFYPEPKDVLIRLPTGVPRVYRPRYAKLELDKVKQTIAKATDLKALDAEEANKWKEQLAKFEDRRLHWAKKRTTLTDKVSKDNVWELCDGPETWPMDDILASVEQRGNRPAEVLDGCEEPGRDFPLPIVNYTETLKRTIKAGKATVHNIKVGTFISAEPDISKCVEWHFDPKKPPKFNYNPIVRPWIGKVLTTPTADGLIRVQWCDGELKQAYVPGREDTISIAEIQHHNFTLTSTNRLRKTQRDNIENCEVYRKASAEFEERILINAFETCVLNKKVAAGKNVYDDSSSDEDEDPLCDYEPLSKLPKQKHGTIRTSRVEPPIFDEPSTSGQ